MNARHRNPRIDLTSQRFGMLTVISWAGNSKWRCKCDCGNTTSVLSANLKRGNTTSCGCIRNIKSSKRATTHGLSNTPAYKTWCGIKARCYNTRNASYKDYGARGIVLADEWVHDPTAFVAHVGQPPSPSHTLDRIDNSKGYVPGNLRWATVIEQANNKSNNRIVHWRGERYTLAQLARKIAYECNIGEREFYDALSDYTREPRK